MDIDAAVVDRDEGLLRNVEKAGRFSSINSLPLIAVEWIWDIGDRRMAARIQAFTTLSRSSEEAMRSPEHISSDRARTRPSSRESVRSPPWKLA